MLLPGLTPNEHRTVFIDFGSGYSVKITQNRKYLDVIYIYIYCLSIHEEATHQCSPHCRPGKRKVVQRRTGGR